MGSRIHGGYAEETGMRIGKIDNPHIHIEGMGLTGALLAVQLMDRMGHTNWSWHDIESHHTAWKASTGAIYPSGSEKFGPDLECWKVWDIWEQRHLYGIHCERANYFFGHKKPPHEGKYKVFERTPELRMGDLPSFHINGQSLVQDIRARYKGYRTTGVPEQTDVLIIAHGWSERLARVYWGWTELVELEYDECMFGGLHRPCVYFRPNKVQMAYAYPVPGTPYWYAGSSIIAQRTEAMKSLDIPSKSAKWEVLFHKLSGGAFRVKDRGGRIEGWRPAAGPSDTSWAKASWNGQMLRVSMRPLWNSGIRHFPKQLASLYQALGWFDAHVKNLYDPGSEVAVRGEHL
jgi:hypothetical protein